MLKDPVVDEWSARVISPANSDVDDPLRRGAENSERFSFLSLPSVCLKYLADYH